MTVFAVLTNYCSLLFILFAIINSIEIWRKRHHNDVMTFELLLARQLFEKLFPSYMRKQLLVFSLLTFQCFDYLKSSIYFVAGTQTTSYNVKLEVLPFVP